MANALVAGTVYTAAQPNITSVGTLSSLSVTGNIDTAGNINGANIVASAGHYFIGDGSLITNLPGGSYGNSNVTSLLSNLGPNVISSTGNITTTANVSAGYVIGDGSALTSLTGANVVGAVANATFATDSAHATVADSANAVAGGNVTGQVANALVAGTVYTAAQPAITSVGTLTSLAVTGNISGGNVISGVVTYTPVDGTAEIGRAHV